MTATATASAATIRSIAKLRDEINKVHGEGSAYFAKDIPPPDIITSGSLSLDYAVGLGGLPNNCVMEICGPEGIGKTSFAFVIVRQYLDAFPTKGIVILDVEHKISPEWAAKLIGEHRMDRVMIMWPDTAEQATDMYVAACKSEAVSAVVFDSIGGAPTQRVTEKSAEVGNVGGNALAITRFAQLAQIHSDKYRVLTIGINQLRDGMNPRLPHATRTPGGRGWKHACALRIQLKPGGEDYEETINSEKIRVGYKVKAVVIKSGIGVPYRTAEWNFFNVPTEKYGPIGIDTTDEIARLSKATGVFQMSGSHFNHPALPGGKVNGVKALAEALRADDALRMTVTSEIMASLRDGQVNASEVAPIIDSLDGLALDDSGDEAAE